jgi:hypothetical protein
VRNRLRERERAGRKHGGGNRHEARQRKEREGEREQLTAGGGEAGANSSRLVVVKLTVLCCVLVFLGVVLQPVCGQFNLVGICLFVFSDSPSGGMKRRLSVAISFIGMTLVCYLDDPSLLRTLVCFLGICYQHFGVYYNR